MKRILSIFLSKDQYFYFEKSYFYFCYRQYYITLKYNCLTLHMILCSELKLVLHVNIILKVICIYYVINFVHRSWIKDSLLILLLKYRFSYFKEVRLCTTVLDSGIISFLLFFYEKAPINTNLFLGH